jgi:hypothetical protein
MYVAAGLGDQPGECYLISGVDNKGDGWMKCNKTEAYSQKGYEVRCRANRDTVLSQRPDSGGRISPLGLLESAFCLS